MDLGLTGKTAVITGGSKGIGRAVAELLASEGVNLHLVSRTEAELTITADAIRQKSNVGVTIHPLDLSDSKNIDKLVEAVGDVDILINNAGAIPGGTLQEIEEERWREAWDLKVFGYINMIRAFYRVLKARGGGTIVNVIGMAGVRPDFNYIAGSAGNASLNSLTRAMGGMSMDDGIRVVACNPGPVQTDRLLTLLKGAFCNRDRLGRRVRALHGLHAAGPGGLSGRGSRSGGVPGVRSGVVPQRHGDRSGRRSGDAIGGLLEQDRPRWSHVVFPSRP